MFHRMVPLETMGGFVFQGYPLVTLVFFLSWPVNLGYSLRIKKLDSLTTQRAAQNIGRS
jgi:hypothetical protein